jgi:hypothetical protein
LDFSSLGLENPSKARALSNLFAGLARRRPRRRMLHSRMAMSDKTKGDKAGRIGEILNVMRNTWDLPADCNEGELFAYAETLYDRIASGDGRDALYAYLEGVQADNLEMPPSDAFRAIVDRALALSEDRRG